MIWRCVLLYRAHFDSGRLFLSIVLTIVYRSTRLRRHIRSTRRGDGIALAVLRCPSLWRNIVGLAIVVNDARGGGSSRGKHAVGLSHVRKRLSFGDDSDGVSRVLAEKRNRVAMAETPFEPKLERLPSADFFPVFAQQLLILPASCRLCSSKACNPQGKENPENSAEAQAALSNHEATEPKVAFKKTEKKDSRDDGSNNDDPCSELGAPCVPRTHFQICN